ncbi:MAG: glycosyltransferase family 4 protein [Rickettsiales bacterium]|nr:glycosyltransferase family 4 protein [Rickettsiales bacterium]
MKIINAIFSQNIGGVNQVFKDYANVLSDLGHEVFLVISNNQKCCYGDVKKKGVFILRNISPIFDLFHLFWIVLRFKPDVIICHSGRMTKLTKILQKVFSFKTINVNHGTTVKYSLNCDLAISVNGQISALAVACGVDKEKSFTVDNAINIDQKYEESPLSKQTTIGSFGRIERAKGFDILITAFGILVNDGLNVRLKIGGFEIKESGYGFDDLKKLAKKLKVEDKIDFVGLVEDKKDFFANIDIFCMPSREETFGIPIIESFLHSVLVVSSDTDGGKLIIRDRKNGFLFKNQDSGDLAQKIKVVIENKDNYVKYTKNAFIDLEEKFSYTKLGENLSAILNKLI